MAITKSKSNYPVLKGNYGSFVVTEQVWRIVPGSDKAVCLTTNETIDASIVRSWKKNGHRLKITLEE